MLAYMSVASGRDLNQLPLSEAASPLLAHQFAAPQR